MLHINQVENKVKGILMNEIDKIKIDILRDALKDSIDTIRALDKKIVFLVSYNAVFLGFIVTIFLKYKDVEKILVSSYKYFYYCLGVLGFIWACVFIIIMIGINPKHNPIEVFKNKEDKDFSNNVFFILTNGKESLQLNELLDNFDKINSLKNIYKLLYKEIGKTAYIRDMKSKSVSKSVNFSWKLTLVFIIIVTSFSLQNLIINDKIFNDNNITKSKS